jgi:serine/threonine protein kinase
MSDESVPISLGKRVDQACDRFEKAWKAGQGPRIEAYVAEVPEPGHTPLLRELLALELELRRNAGERPTPEEYHGRFPEHIELIDAFFANSPGDADSEPPGSSGRATTPHTPPTESSTAASGPPLPSGSPPPPDHIGRYKVIRRLGGGAYGDVYLAHDGVMDRQVAVKVPSAKLLATERAREEFLREARNAARLQHEGIVRAYDFGQELDGRCYIVYELVEGESLAERIKPGRIAAVPLSPQEAARIVAEAAEALHYAHVQEVFHRDIKPANILLNRQGRPKVTDFGLAVHEQELASQRGILAGTLLYMSPEQVRRESHHIDGRTDIYSLGVVLYELLCGRRPFEAKTEDELIDQILHREARPPRQVYDSIPRELEHTCLKAISKPVAARYTTAKDMAQALWAVVSRARVLPAPAPGRLDVESTHSGDPSEAGPVDVPCLPNPAPTPSGRVCTDSEIGRQAHHDPVQIPSFHYGSVVPPEFFIGRKEELSEAAQLIRDGHGFLLVGNRRSGKTSFCYKLIHEVMGSPGNNILAAYLNLQNCQRLTIKTFLEHTLLSLIGEVARQVFHCKYTELLGAGPSVTPTRLSADADFASFVDLFGRVKQHTHAAKETRAPSLRAPEFIELSQDLLQILRAKQWRRCVVFYDEANRLPHNLSVDLLSGNQETLTRAGIHSVYAASPEMEKSFQDLGEICGHHVLLGAFRSFDDLRRLLVRYYFQNAPEDAEPPTGPGALDLLWKYSRGLPFVIQWLAGESFRAAHKQNSPVVEVGHVEQAYEELKRAKPQLLDSR